MSNSLYASLLEPVLNDTFEHPAPGTNYTFLSEGYPVRWDVPDLKAQVDQFLSLPKPALPPNETLWIFSFGTWDIWSLAAFPRNEIFARVRLADVLQVKIGPQGMERLRAFRKIANQHVGFVVCDRDMTIIAIVDSKEPDQVINPRDQKLEVIKQRCLQAAQVKYICVYPPQLPRYRELREQILGPAADLV